MTADESIAGLATLLLKTLLELIGHTLLLIWKLAVWLIGHLTGFLKTKLFKKTPSKSIL